MYIIQKSSQDTNVRQSPYKYKRDSFYALKQL